LTQASVPMGVPHHAAVAAPTSRRGARVRRGALEHDDVLGLASAGRVCPWLGGRSRAARCAGRARAPGNRPRDAAVGARCGRPPARARPLLDGLLPCGRPLGRIRRRQAVAVGGDPGRRAVIRTVGQNERCRQAERSLSWPSDRRQSERPGTAGRFRASPGCSSPKGSTWARKSLHRRSPPRQSRGSRRKGQPRALQWPERLRKNWTPIGPQRRKMLASATAKYWALTGFFFLSGSTI